MTTHLYDMVDLRRQTAAWLAAREARRADNPNALRLVTAHAITQVDAAFYAELVSLAVCGASMIARDLARHAGHPFGRPPGLIVARPRDPATEPGAASRVATALVVTIANGRFFDAAAQANAWGSFDPAGVTRLVNLLDELLEMLAEVAG